MIALGVVLVVLGLIFGMSILTYVGVVALVIGAVFWLLGAAGHAVGGRRVWY
jgi:fatty-acid desaturase